jgi:predicted MFS family arabinose efflux permease
MTGQSSIRRRRAIFIVGAFAYVLSQFYRSFLTVVVDDLTRDLGIGPKEFGLLGASWFFAFALAQFAVGAALDRLGPRRTIAGMMIFAVIGAVLFSIATSQWTAIVAMALIGLGCAPILMGALYFLARTEEPSRFAALGGIFLGCGFLGSLVAASPLAALVEAIGWRSALQLSAGVTALAALGVALVYFDPPQAEKPVGGSLFGDLFDLMRRPVLWPIFLMSITVTGTIATERSLWVGPFFGEVYGFSVLDRGHAALLLSIGMTLSAIFSGPIAEKIGNPKRVVLVANTLTGLAFLALALVPGLSAFSALVLIGLAGVFGMTYAVLLAHARLFMPNHVIGRGMTFVNFLSIGGSGVLQVITGRNMEAMKLAGLSPSASFSSLHVLLAVVALCTSAIYVFSPTRPKE